MAAVIANDARHGMEAGNSHEVVTDPVIALVSVPVIDPVMGSQSGLAVVSVSARVIDQKNASLIVLKSGSATVPVPSTEIRTLPFQTLQTNALGLEVFAIATIVMATAVVQAMNDANRPSAQDPAYDEGRSQRPDPAPEAAAATPPADDLIWGRHATQAALEAGRPIHRIWCTAEMRSASKFLQLLRDAKASGVLVEEVTWARLGQITGGSVHQGIALQTAAAETLDLDSLIEGCSDLGEPPLLVALDGVTDPHNLGAVVRSAEAMGAHGVVIPQRRSAGLTGSAAKVAAGAPEHLPVARVVNLNRSLEKLKDAGYRVVGLAAEGDVTLTDVDLSGPMVLVTGSEDQGLSLMTRRHCDQLVRIPLRGITPSLNASVATALCVYEVARRNWMKDIHGQSPSPPIRRPKLAGAESPVDATEASETAALPKQPAFSEQPEAPVEKAPEQLIDLDLNPSQPDAALSFDQNIQLSP